MAHLQQTHWQQELREVEEEEEGNPGGKGTLAGKTRRDQGTYPCTHSEYKIIKG